MKKILIFSGTTEGRTLAQRLAKMGVSVEVCVATEYGELMMEEEPLVKVHTGRLEEDQMEQFFTDGGFDLIVDATHPFATVVTKNIVKATNNLGIEYIRVEREIVTPKDNGLNRFFENTSQCVEALKKLSGKILLTTGSKELKLFCEDEELKNRVIARILPGLESLQIAYDCGIDGRQIIAMHGPFSQSMNENMIRDYNVSCLVTKESGHTGGMEEKLLAASSCGIPCYIIKKPEAVTNNSYTVEEAYRKLISPPRKIAVNLIGIGMGDPNGLTINAKEALESSDIIFGAKRMLEITKSNAKKYPYYLEKDILPILIEESKNKELTASVLFSGDTGFFSGCEKLNKALSQYDNIEAKIYMGASSLSYFSSKTGISYQDAKILSMHGVSSDSWKPELLDLVGNNKKVFFITSGAKDVSLAGELLNKNFPNVVVHLGFELSYENEQILKLTPKECINISKEGLYVGMIINEEATGKILTPGVNDEEFIRDKVPMTKEEVRVISICKLGLKADSVVYDIGSGTGSIAVEMAMLSPKIKVYAIEVNELALDLIRQNKEKFGASNVEVISALAPEGLENLPAPTHAFIGGSKGNLKEILLSLRDKNPGMRVVINAVSMETIVQTQEIFKELNIEDVDICMVNISKAKKLGGYNLMQAANPVYIYSFNF